METLVIEITLAGSVRAMHSDEFPLSFLGKMSVRRQTEIVYEPDMETWRIIYIEDDASRLPIKTQAESLVTGLLSGFLSYELAIDFEKHWINKCRKKGVCPISDEGYRVAKILRDKHGKYRYKKEKKSGK